MRTIGISGTDWTGNDAHWIRRPHHSLHRNNVEDWADMFYQIANKGRIDAVAMGIRGSWDVDSVKSLPNARAAWQHVEPKCTLMPWYDTGGLPSCIASIPFDFANEGHIAAGWQEYARIFFDHFKDAKLERTPDGRLLCAWWGINSSVGQLNGRDGFTNQHACQRLLDRVDAEIAALGLGTTAHIVDVTWLQHAPGLKVFGVHEWFDPWNTPKQSYTIHNHAGIVTLVTVPSFWNNNVPAPGGDLIPPDGGTVLARGLKAARDVNATYAMIEGVTDGSEGAMVIAHKNADGSANEDNLNALRRHMELTTGVPMPEPEPIEPEPIVPPVSEPVKVMATFAISRRESFKHPTKPDLFVTWYPKGQRDTILSVQADGEISTRLLSAEGMPDRWESWKEEGNRAVFETSEYYAIPLVD